MDSTVARTIFCITFIGLPASILPGATFTVDRVDDEPTATNCNPVAAIDCSLRGAITASNLTPGEDTILVPAGVFEITFDGGGQLAIRDDVEIFGTGETPFVIRRLANEPERFRLLDLRGDPDPIDVRIENCAIEGGSVFSAGGGAAVTNSSLELVDCSVTDNEALSSDGFPPNGGGLGVFTGGKLTLISSSVSGNRAESRGGGIFAIDGEVVVMDSVLGQNQVLANTSGRGGAIYAQNSEVVLIRSTLLDNGLDVEMGVGGAVGSDSQLTIIESIINENTATQAGGAIWSEGTVDIIGSTIAGNRVRRDTTGLGGGVFMEGGSTLTMSESLVWANEAAQEGAGVWVGLTAQVTITNTTFSGNEAGTFGGGILSAGAVSLLSSTFSGNFAAVQGDNIFFSQGTTNLRNILVDGTCGAILGNANSQGGNLESPGDTCFFDAPSDQVGVSVPDLALAGLADNGGPTQTHALLSGSVAIDAGTVECPLVDQRMWWRIDGECDVGAFELGADPQIIFTDGFESGDTSVWSSSL